MTTIRAAAVQLTPVLENAVGTVEKVCNAVRDLAARGVQFMVFPETFVPYYPYFSFVRPPAAIGAEHLRLYENAPTIPGPATDAVADAVRRTGTVVVLGVNERDHGTLYNAQLVFDADGRIKLHRRKITPTYHERMIWGQGDGAGLQVVDTAVGRVGALACWEHYNPLARYALMTQHEEIHAAQFPGSLVGPIFADQMEVTVRYHALEAACFVVNSCGWLTDDQVAAITGSIPEQERAGLTRAVRGGSYTAIISPEGVVLGTPVREGEGAAVADLDLSLITKRKRMMDSVGHYARPELLSLRHDTQPARTRVTDEPASLAPRREPTPDHRPPVVRGAAD